MTAGGKLLAATRRIDLKKTLEAWQALPASERAPGSVQVPSQSAVDRQHVELAPPAGGLILKVHLRAFMRDDNGKFRYVTGKDLRQGEQGETTLEADYEQGRTAAHEAQPHHMWLTEAEWKSLMPVNPRKADQVPLPAGVADRILRWHLNPLRFYGRYGPDALNRQEVRAGELTLTVEEVLPQAVRLRLEGFGKFGEVPPAAVAEGKIASLDRWGYEPHVLGYLEYDPQDRVFTRFDIVALGDHFGRLGNGRRAPTRIGLQPLGIAFELIKGDQPADRVPPGRPSDSRSYFDLSNK